MYTALDMNTAWIACVASTPGDQPEMSPSSEAKMNRAAPAAVPLLTTKSLEPLKTMPVGAPGSLADADGTVTTSDSMFPRPSYSVDLPVPLSATQMGLVALNAMPQPFLRLSSRCSAGTPPSDTRLRTA